MVQALRILCSSPIEQYQEFDGRVALFQCTVWPQEDSNSNRNQTTKWQLGKKNQLLFIYFRTPTHGILLPRAKADLLTPVNLIQKSLMGMSRGVFPRWLQILSMLVSNIKHAQINLVDVDDLTVRSFFSPEFLQCVMYLEYSCGMVFIWYILIVWYVYDIFLQYGVYVVYSYCMLCIWYIPVVWYVFGIFLQCCECLVYSCTVVCIWYIPIVWCVYGIFLEC